MNEVEVVIVVLTSMCAALFDLRTRRIPNVLTGGMVVGGIVAQAITHGAYAAICAAMLAVAAIVIGSVLHACGTIGGGDVKFIAGALAVVGPAGALLFLTVTALAGGILALIVAVRRGRFLRIVREIAWAVAVPGTPFASSSSEKIPYGVAIGIGAVASLLCLHLKVVAP